jgi:hypothetical protein
LHLLLNFPYDGNEIGSFNECVIIEHTYNIYSHGGVQNNISGGVFAGYNAVSTNAPARDMGNYGVMRTNNGPIVNIGTETAPAWIGVLVCISY